MGDGVGKVWIQIVLTCQAKEFGPVFRKWTYRCSQVIDRENHVTW